MTCIMKRGNILNVYVQNRRELTEEQSMCKEPSGFSKPQPQSGPGMAMAAETSNVNANFTKRSTESRVSTSEMVIIVQYFPMIIRSIRKCNIHFWGPQFKELKLSLSGRGSSE